MSEQFVSPSHAEIAQALEMLQELRLKDSPRCIQEATEWLEFASTTGDESLEADFLLLIAQAHHNTANPELALHYAVRASTLFERLENHLCQARSQNIIALSERAMGNGHRALSRLKSLLLFSQKQELLRTELVAHLNIGYVCSELSMLETGIEYCKKGIEMLARYPDRTLAANLYNNLAYDTIRLGLVEECRAYSKACFENIDRDEDPVMYSIALESRSHLHVADGNFEAAIRDVEEAYQIQVATQNTERQVECLLRLGVLHGLQKDWDLSESFLRRALAVSEAQTFTPLRREVLHELAHVRQEQGDFAEAYQFQRLAFDAAAEKAKTDMSRAISALEQGHEFDLANREAELLREKNLQLQQSEERFELAARGSSHGIWDWWLADEHAYFSQRYVEMMGFTPESFPTRVADHCEFFHPEDVESHYAQLDEAYNTGLLRSQVRLKVASGEYRWFFINAVTVRNEAGETTRMVGSLADIQDRKVAEEEMISAKNHAEQLSRLKSEFLANMSHEIRTPMNGVIGLTELLLLNETDDESRSYLETIQTCGKSLLTIINDILDFSKIEAGKLELVSEPLDLTEVVANCKSLFEPEAIRRRLALRISAPSYAVPVFGDQVRIQQVLNNLVGNALKFTEKGGIDISLHAEKRSGNTVGVTLRVKDSGIGIAAERLDSIFDSFTQADGSTTRKYGGTGLGLTICRRLVDLMNGEIRLESQLGLGSTFEVTFELPAAGEMASEGKAGTPVGARPIRVLLVEDHAINRRLAGAQLERLGCDFRAVEDGRQAVDLLETETFDLVFMDLQMPVLDGLEATRIIREREQQSGGHLPIVALTANALPQDRVRCMEAGMDDYLSKPFVLRDLLQMIHKYAPADVAWAA